MLTRYLKLELSAAESCFLWGPRQTGKSTLLKILFPEAPYYDLLLSNEYRRFIANPAALRQECEALGLNGKTQKFPIIIDEVQKVPELLDEIHWLIENRSLRFVLCGSSPRKVKRSQANLLGGRAVRYTLLPLVYPEIPDFDLSRALHHGLLPRHYLSSAPEPLLESYIGEYLREEIAAEAVNRNIPAFGRFLEVAALANGEMVNFNNIASDCGISAPTVKSYFHILEDTLVGRFLPAFRRRIKRRLIGAPRFFFFDVGLVGRLTRRGKINSGSELFGRAFEHFITLEVMAHSEYSGEKYPITYWRTAAQQEVDLVLGDAEIAIEVKSSANVTERHLRGLRAFREEHKAKALLICMETRPRKLTDGIEILPWRHFLDRLWSKKII